MKRLSILTLLVFLAVALMGCPLFLGPVATPEISPPDGTDLLGSPAQVTITTSTASATIYYTLDGSDPTTSSTRYTGPFTVTPDHAPPEVVKAIAVWHTFMQDSEVATATYTWGW